jgi:cation diffusion facilitator family transporter
MSYDAKDRRAGWAMKASLLLGFVMLALKLGAYLITGSAAILGDAAESVVHVAAVMFAAYSFTLVGKPADEDHRYGHSKAEFFSAGVEGALIIIAAVYISYVSISHWIGGTAPANLDRGVPLIAATVGINLVLGLILLREGKRASSLILTANGHHVLTDAWTSLGALLGLGLMTLTGQTWWDPVCGLLIAANILYTGFTLISRSVGGLMDSADPHMTRRLDHALAHSTHARGVTFHALRHRDSGSIHWVEVHLQFPDDISLKAAHRIATEIEREVIQAVEKKVIITTHLECLGDEDHDETHPGERGSL